MALPLDPRSPKTAAGFLARLIEALYLNAANWMAGATRGSDPQSRHLLVGGLYQTTPQTITDGQTAPFQTDSHGNLIATLSASGLVIGHVIVDSGTITAVTTITNPVTVTGTVAVSGTVTITGAVTNAGTFAVQNNGTGKTLKTVSGNLTADTDVIAAVSSKRLKIYALTLLNTGTDATLLLFKSNGTGGTELWRTRLQGATGAPMGYAQSVSVPTFLFATAAGEKLTIDTNQTDPIDYSIAYWDDDAT